SDVRPAHARRRGGGQGDGGVGGQRHGAATRDLAAAKEEGSLAAPRKSPALSSGAFSCGGKCGARRSGMGEESRGEQPPPRSPSYLRTPYASLAPPLRSSLSAWLPVPALPSVTFATSSSSHSSRCRCSSAGRHRLLRSRRRPEKTASCSSCRSAAPTWRNRPRVT